ncbi:photosynthetic NDH subunit of lumenal location 4, chloroplastic [Olea europaea var. sylvestris]|uniref:photosynthetic NDH subunit of lumenal location 4, chloroplastic n=1 Tax=Olea europaea var. sylvestris TaxID=158386 RepID=UPI000C1D4EFA|nr:photosynthetic NDH subunit of lumenal location 4, chloroplastic [Olea europaea var. sylvestris]XP_022844364.1 photosynthetic NDH subunit of lumenal location 4, chloroplastic [Olea europaea var. sylvestris]XP_022844365.1 photosynthetic NDH subunit of lumenal location 4, chloroplastic [Olea europaea var. sylvestris]
MAATSPLTVITPVSRSLQTLKTSVSSSLHCTTNPIPNVKKHIFQVGVGLLAASVVAAAPLEAEATRIEYYATFAEPSCELNFVRSGLGYCDLAVGSGEVVPFGQLINVHYTARFADGIVFDSSYKRARPLTMRLGLGKVIKGLDQGILGGGGVPPMQVGGKRKIHIPPHLAYGPEPAGCFSGDCNIPANATLVYDVKFVDSYKGNRK